MDILETLAATAELCGSPMSKPALSMLAMDLDGYPQAVVLDALRKCRREHKGRLTVEAIVSRIDDGRPGVEAAWSMIPRDEGSTVVWTEEMAKAYGAASPLLADGDVIAARMAFREVYIAEVARARDASEPVKWTPSLGHDPAGRESALRDAVERGRITMDKAMLYLPHCDFTGSSSSDQTHKVLALAAKAIKGIKK
jgi:hypothetical protein